MKKEKKSHLSNVPESFRRTAEAVNTTGSAKADVCAIGITYPKQMYTKIISVKATESFLTHAWTGSGNWRAYNILPTVFSQKIEYKTTPAAPAPAITMIGFIFSFLRRKKLTPKIKTEI